MSKINGAEMIAVLLKFKIIFENQNITIVFCELHILYSDVIVLEHYLYLKCF